MRPDNHTGNVDIERLYNIIPEKIKVLLIEQKSLNTKEKISKALE